MHEEELPPSTVGAGERGGVVVGGGSQENWMDLQLGSADEG